MPSTKRRECWDCVCKNRESLDKYLQSSGNCDAVLVDNDKTGAAYIPEIKNRTQEHKYHPLWILTSKFRTSSMAVAL